MASGFASGASLLEEKATRLEHSNELYRRELERTAVPVSEASVLCVPRSAGH